MKNLLIVGDRGSGKSFLIRRLLLLNRRPVWGFFTRKEEFSKKDLHVIRIYRASDENLSKTLGTCNGKEHEVNLEVFNIFGRDCLRNPPKNALIVMDELGFMEEKAQGFVLEVFKALDGGLPVLAAVKNRPDVPFIRKILDHPDSEVLFLTEKNRDEVYEKAARKVKLWNKVFESGL